MPPGTVIHLESASCVVLSGGEAIRCTLPGKWRLRPDRARPVAVGDRVTVALKPNGDAVVEAIGERTGGVLCRTVAGARSRRGAEERQVEQVVAANVDQLVIVASVADPPLNRRLIDRLAVSGEHGELDVVLCINKVDLARPPAYRPALDLYGSLGYGVLATSAATGEGLGRLRETLEGKTSVLAGPSGVGKSSLLNAIQPGLELRVGTVSDSTSKGRHTTSAVSLLPLDGGGYVVDTPGIREFDLFNLECDELKHYFPEMAERFGQCRFADCSHRAEPGCAVRAAAERGQIARARYESYLRIYESLPEPPSHRRNR